MLDSFIDIGLDRIKTLDDMIQCLMVVILQSLKLSSVQCVIQNAYGKIERSWKVERGKVDVLNFVIDPMVLQFTKGFEELPRKTPKRVPFQLGQVKFYLDAGSDESDVGDFIKHLIEKYRILSHFIAAIWDREKLANRMHQVEQRLTKKVANSQTLVAQINQFSRAIHDRNLQLNTIFKNIPLGIFSFNYNFEIDENFSQALKSLLNLGQIAKKDAYKEIFSKFDLTEDQLVRIKSILTSAIGEVKTSFQINRFHLPGVVKFPVWEYH